MSRNEITRRHFLIDAVGAISAAAYTADKKILKTTQAKSGFKSPNEKLNIAAIGVGGKGASDVDTCNSENIVALCDVDGNSAAGSFSKYSKAKKYKDFRKMLEECQEIDALTITVPDHMHAYIALRCMEMGKHVYVQKPLAHTVLEARTLREAAHKYKVATQMGNQGAASDLHREVCEMIWAGWIGSVREVHSWTDRPKDWWPQGMPDALPAEPIPKTLDWDLWLGTAPVRPYNKGYCPFVWRGWWDFGTGALGDIACHSLSPVVKALKLEYPVSVECLHLKNCSIQSYPTESILRYEFPQREKFAPVTLYWYDGLLKPKLPAGISESAELLSEKSGVMFVGNKGLIVMKGKLSKNVLVVNGKVIEKYKKPDPILPRLPHIAAPKDQDGGLDLDRMHKQDWIRSIKTGSVSGSNFDHAGPLTEWVVMGNISLKFPNRKLEWDGANMRFTNLEEANALVTKKYRTGWKLI